MRVDIEMKLDGFQNDRVRNEMNYQRFIYVDRKMPYEKQWEIEIKQSMCACLCMCTVVTIEATQWIKIRIYFYLITALWNRYYCARFCICVFVAVDFIVRWMSNDHLYCTFVRVPVLFFVVFLRLLLKPLLLTWMALYEQNSIYQPAMIANIFNSVFFFWTFSMSSSQLRARFTHPSLLLIRLNFRSLHNRAH